jgi:hypothetical protein
MGKYNKYFLGKYQILLVEDDDVSLILQVFDNTHEMAEWLDKNHHGLYTTVCKIFYGERKWLRVNKVKCNLEFLEMEGDDYVVRDN